MRVFGIGADRPFRRSHQPALSSASLAALAAPLRVPERCRFASNAGRNKAERTGPQAYRHREHEIHLPSARAAVAPCAGAGVAMALRVSAVELTSAYAGRHALHRSRSLTSAVGGWRPGRGRAGPLPGGRGAAQHCAPCGCPTNSPGSYHKFRLKLCDLAFVATAEDRERRSLSGTWGPASARYLSF